MAGHLFTREVNAQSRALLRRHREWVDEVDEARLAVERERASLVAEAAFLLNTKAPIHRLPLEIFADILLASTDDDPKYLEEQHLPQLQALAQVSRFWREVVLTTPAFWIHISGSMTQKQIDWSLKRSHDAGLHIYMTSTTGPFTPKWEKVAETSHRWKTFVHHGSDKYFQLLQIALSKHTRLLETLDLDFDPSFTTPKTYILHLAEGRPLVNISLARVGLSWTAGQLSGLKHLKLVSLDAASPSLRQLLVMLAASSELMVLHLVDIHLSPSERDDLAEAETVPPFCLHDLYELALIDIRHDAYSALLRRLPWASCVALDLRPNPPPSPEDLFDHSTSEDAELLALLLHEEGPVHVELGAEGFLMMTDKMWKGRAGARGHRARMLPEGFAFQFYLPADDPISQSLLRQLQAILSLDHRLVVELQLSYPAPDTAWSLALQTLNPVLRRLVFQTDSKPVVGEIIAGLGRNRADHTGKPVWPCPKLRSVALGSVRAQVLDDLIASVKPRWEVCVADDEELGKRHAAIVNVTSSDERRKPREAIKLRPVSRNRTKSWK